MRKLVYLLIIVATVTLSACDRSTRYADLDGNQLTLKQFKGKWLLINYWASWCKSCYQEIPELNNFYQKHKKDGILLVGVNYDLVPSEQLRKLVNQFHIAFPVLTTDPAKELGINDIPGLPSTYVIGPDGQVAKRLFGVQTEKSLEEALQTKLSLNGKYNGRYLHT